ncbi:HNH endonuclease [Rhodococcus sp. NPDC019627]|uniref:HNH endonuclease n=1 Tax=unclassified Rhodococcus (in: high G+C Gram-positive bacteria) TaxID=192944 RepID=UPI0037A37A7A
MSQTRVESRRYKALKREFRAACLESMAPCWMCGQEIHYAAADDEPDAFNLDHFYPWSTHPELREDPGNFRASHRACNIARGNGEAPLALGEPSEDW